MSDPSGQPFVVGRIGKPHGLRGEVTVRPHTDDPARRFVAGAAFATDPAERGPLHLETVRVHQGVYLLGFAGTADRSAAEALRGTMLLLAGEGVQAGDDDEDDAWRAEELVGLEVVLVDGTVVGTVGEVHLRPAQDLLEVALRGGGQAFVPFVHEIVPEVVPATDDQPGRVVIDPPAGLLDLGE